MDTFKIKAIIAAAEYGSLSKAAEEFSYTPSAFSHMTNKFENEIGIRIFERNSKGVDLTEEGSMILCKLKSILNAENELFEEVARLTSSQAKNFRIAAYSSVSRSLLSDVIKEFKSSKNETAISVNIADDLRGWIENDRADLVIAEEIAFGNTKWFPLMDDRYSIISPKSLLNDKKYITVEELYEQPYIFVDDTISRRTFDTKKFREFIYFKSEDDLSVIKLVEEGIGVTMLPNLVINGNVENINVIDLIPNVKRTIGYAYKECLKNSPVLKEIIRLLKNKCKKI